LARIYVFGLSFVSSGESVSLDEKREKRVNLTQISSGTADQTACQPLEKNLATLDSGLGGRKRNNAMAAPRGTGAFFRNERFRDGDARVRREGVRPPLARVGVGVRCCSSRW
jgi:hypothetical protein